MLLVAGKDWWRIRRQKDWKPGKMPNRNAKEVCCQFALSS